MRIPLPQNIDTTVCFVNEKDEVVAQAELIVLESRLSQSSQGLNLKKPEDRDRWMQNYAVALSTLLSLPISMSLATLIAEEVTKKFKELKKNFAGISTLPSFMESMPSLSTQPPSPSTTEIFPVSPPSGNCEPAPPEADSAPIEHTTLC